MSIFQYLIVLVFVTSTSAARAQSIDLYMPDAPPLTMHSQDGRLGIVGDVTVAAAKRAGISLEIQNLPWARAQRDVSGDEDKLIIPLSRTPERESKYTWIAKVVPMERAFFSLGKPVKDLAEAQKKYKRVAVGLGTAQHEILKNSGFPDSQIHALSLGDKPLIMLELDRVDAWFTTVYEGLYDWPGSEASRVSRKLQMSPVISSVDLYVACSLKCNEYLVNKLRAAIHAMEKDGSIRRIEQSYVKTLLKEK